jgi:K+-transporting ATPase ATPase B chain
MIFRGLPVVDAEAPPRAGTLKLSGMIYRGLSVPDAALTETAPAPGTLPGSLPPRARVVLSLGASRELSGPDSSAEEPAPAPTAGLLLEAWREALPRLRPDPGEPVLLLIQVVTCLALLLALAALASGQGGGWVGWLLPVDAGLLLGVLAIPFTRALRAVRERRRAEALRERREAIPAFRLCKLGAGQPLLQGLAGTGSDDGSEGPDYYEVEETASTSLRRGDLVLVETGQVIPGDGEIVAGTALIDEAAVTGESAPALREAEGTLAAVHGGTRLLSGRIVVSVTEAPRRRPAAG